MHPRSPVPHRPQGPGTLLPNVLSLGPELPHRCGPGPEPRPPAASVGRPRGAQPPPRRVGLSEVTGALSVFAPRPPAVFVARMSRRGGRGQPVRALLCARGCGCGGPSRVPGAGLSSEGPWGEGRTVRLGVRRLASDRRDPSEFWGAGREGRAPEGRGLGAPAGRAGLGQGRGQKPPCAVGVWGACRAAWSGQPGGWSTRFRRRDSQQLDPQVGRGKAVLLIYKNVTETKRKRETHAKMSAGGSAEEGRTVT